MSISYTNKLKLRQITYLHDGEESADAYNETLTILDALSTYFLSFRSITTNESAGTNTPVSVSVILDRATGQPVLNRLALPF